MWIVVSQIDGDDRLSGQKVVFLRSFSMVEAWNKYCFTLYNVTDSQDQIHIGHGWITVTPSKSVLFQLGSLRVNHLSIWIPAI